jgi:hypothetical protein
LVSPLSSLLCNLIRFHKGSPASITEFSQQFSFPGQSRQHFA